MKEQLLIIKQKIEHLLEQNSSLKSDNERLLEEIENLKIKLSKKEQELHKFEEADKNQLTTEKNGALEIEHIRERLTEQIENIDQCIDWLNNTEDE